MRHRPLYSFLYRETVIQAHDVLGFIQRSITTLGGADIVSSQSRGIKKAPSGAFYFKTD
jgi:hypothetical protein